MHNFFHTFDYCDSFYGRQGIYPIEGWCFHKFFDMVHKVLVEENPEVYHHVTQVGCDSVHREYLRDLYYETYLPGQKSPGQLEAEKLQEIMKEMGLE
jgi:hypothetical protein